MRASFVRAETASAGESVSRNVRDAAERKVPNVLVVGAREQAAGSVMLRRHGVERQLSLSVDDFERLLLDAIARRAPEPRR